MLQLITAEYALLDPAEPAVADVAVAVEGARIIAVGQRAELHRQFPAAPEVGGADRVLIPALINSHDHGRGLGTLPLGVADDLLEIWLPGLYAQPVLDPYLAALFDGLRLARSGVGAVAHSHNPRDWLQMNVEAEATIRGYRDAGIRVAFHPPIVDQNQLVYANRSGFLASLPPELRPAAERLLAPPPLDRADYFALCDDLFERYHDAEGYAVQIQASPAGGQWCSDNLISEAVDWAQQHGSRVQMHMLETRYHAAYAQQTWGETFPRHLDRIGALGPWLTLAHMVWADPADSALLAERGVGIAHNPSSNLRLRSGTAPLPAFLAAGVKVGIGLDGHTLDEDQDALRELRLAWTLANKPGATAPTVAAETIWQAGTVDGAAITFGPDAPLGRIAPGLLADLVLLTAGAGMVDWTIGLAAESPLANIAERVPALLLRSASRQHVADVMVNGNWIVRDGRSTMQDEAAVVAEIRAQLATGNAGERRQAALDAHALAPWLRQFYAEME